MKYSDQRIFRTFEEFEREELRRADGLGSGLDTMLGEMLTEELDFGSRSSRQSSDDDED